MGQVLGSYSVYRHSRDCRGYRHVMHHWHDPDGMGTLVCLHGAGVAAELTWKSMVTTLQGYRDVYCPDLRGMGRSHPLGDTEIPFTAHAVAEDVADWLRHCHVTSYDLVGYSFGGLVALLLHGRGPAARRLVLIESALFERASIDVLRDLRQRYADVADQLLTDTDPSAGVLCFLELVAPFRSRHPRVERMTIQRLSARPAGFAFALKAVNEAAWTLDRASLIASVPRTLAILGGNSRPESQALSRQLAETHSHWSVEVIPGVDHALPYQKPGQVAQAIMRFLGPED